MKIYESRNEWEPGGAVLVNGAPLDPCLVVEPGLAPDGTFMWGYTGAGCRRLAIAILADCLGAEMAKHFYISFTEEEISKLPKDRDWTMTEKEVVQSIERIKITQGIQPRG